MKIKRCRQRGFSIAEVLTVSVICAILLTAMVLMVPMILKAPRQIQSQVDDVNTAAIALYKLRRDFSESDTTGVMGCTIAPVSCASYASPTSVTALAVASPDNGSGQFVNTTTAPGWPNWDGVIVYWLVPNSDGTAFDLMRAFIPEGPNVIGYGPNGVPLLSVATAQAAVAAALLISPPPVLSNYIKSMQVATDPVTNIVTFNLTAGTTSGNALSSTTFASNTYARN